MRKRFVGLVMALVSLLAISGCYWLGPWGCSRAMIPDCKTTVLSEAVSPSGAHKARVTVQTCSYDKKFTSSTTSVNVTGLQTERARVVVGFNVAADGRLPDGWPVFAVYPNRAVSAVSQEAPTDIFTDWRSDSELIITYPAGAHHRCDPPSDLTVHCVERGFATSAPPRPMR